MQDIKVSLKIVCSFHKRNLTRTYTMSLRLLLSIYHITKIVFIHMSIKLLDILSKDISLPAHSINKKMTAD